MMMPKRISMAGAMALAAASCFCSRKTAEAVPRSDAAPMASSEKLPNPCSLVTVEEVGAILKRKLLSSSSGATCEYQNAEEPASSGQAAGSQSGSMEDLMKNLSASSGTPQAPTAITNLTNVKVDLARDDMSEARVKAIYAQVGKTVRRSLDPEKKGLQGTIVVANDIPNVGEWAFTTNVAAINMGFGLSSRGRLLHTRKGPWHLTVGATISPDPGEAALDVELADIARAAIGRLP
jgi:hypothetical protein